MRSGTEACESAGAGGSGETGRTPGPAGTAILQIHPSLRCNLACKHCYSSSGPAAALEVEPAVVEQAIADAAALGYRVVSFSGGEPLVWRGLERSLARARELGLRTTVTTNGFFTSDGRLARIADAIDVLAISLDGPRELHDEIRGSRRAFERLEAGLDAVRASGIPFGFIHTLTRRSAPHLEWLGEYAVAQGARLLQIHPLERTGRAAEVLSGEAPDDELLARAYVAAFGLALRHQGALKVQLDLLYREDLREAPELVYADLPEAGAPPLDGADAPAAERLGLLVLEAGGNVVPAAYGVSPRFRITDVRRRPLAEAWPEFARERLAGFRAFCRELWEELTAPEGALLVNWHEAVVAASHRAGATLPLASAG